MDLKMVCTKWQPLNLSLSLNVLIEHFHPKEMQQTQKGAVDLLTLYMQNLLKET